MQLPRLAVPLAQASVTMRHTAADIEKPVGHMTKILIVDDDTTIRDMLDTVLSEEGYATYQAGNGRDGVALAERVNPELILMDIMMPVCDGATAIGHLRENPRTRAIRVIAMSAGSTLLQRIDQLQADGVLAKPFDLDELLANIEFHLRDSVHA
jgi:DNA-binding response OmpR family regulator